MANGHSVITVCDKNADNNTAHAEFYYRQPGIGDDRYAHIVDSNGSASGCGGWTAPSGGYITAVRGYAVAVSSGRKGLKALHAI